MPIDASIPLSYKPVQTPNMLASMAQGQELGINAFKMNALAQEVGDRDFIRGLDPSSPQYINQIAQRNPKLAMELQKGRTEARTAELDQRTKIGTLLKTSATPVIANPTFENAVMALQTFSKATGEDVTSEFNNLQKIGNNPTAIKKWAMGHALSGDQILAQTDLNAYQKQSLSQSQSHFEQNQNKPQFSIEAGGWVYPPSTSPTNVPAGGATNRPNAPTGAAPTSALTSKFVPVEGITPKPTEDQAKTNSNINRIVIAAKSMSKVLKDNPKALAPTGTETLAQATPLWEGASAPLTNLTRSADRQIVSSGYADIIDALLYLSTGAAYNKEQLAAQREAFLPAWSDKEANKIEKVAKLQDLVRMAKTRTGKAWTLELEKATQQLLPSNLTSEAVPDTTKSGATKSNW